MGKFEDLQRLQELKENGSITDVEFEMEKHKILSSNEATKQQSEGIYVASLVLGIFSLLLGQIPILGLILAIVSLVITIKAKKKLKSNNGKSGLVTAGLVLTIIGLVIAIGSTLMIGGLFMLGGNDSILERASKAVDSTY